MPQPTFSGWPRTCLFGGRPLPNGQGTMVNVNLNDWVSWFLQGDFQQDILQQIVTAQQVYRAEGVRLSSDFGPSLVRLPTEYREGVASFGAALAPLLMAGEQNLSFDNATAIRATFVGAANRTISFISSGRPLRWTMELQFLTTSPWFQDISSSSVPSTTIINAPTAAPSGAVAAGGALATGTYTLQYTFVTASGETAPSPASSNIVLTTGNQQITVSAVTPLPAFATAVKWYFASGPTTGFTVQNNGAGFTLNTAGNGNAPPSSTPATAFSVTYGGSIFAKPVWTLTIPNTSTAPIQSFALTNTMSGEALTITFPGNLAASTAWTITIDSGKLTVTDQNGLQYDFTGSFPLLYQPAGQVNTFTATLTPASGVFTGCTIGGSVTNRWTL